MVFRVESQFVASGREIGTRGDATFEFERLHALLDGLRKSSKLGWVKDVLEHFNFNPEKLYSLIDVLDIGSKLETAANLLEHYGVEKRVDGEGWTRLERDFVFWLPGLPRHVNKWHFSFKREIRAFRLSTTVDTVDFKIECCLGKKLIEDGGVAVLAKIEGERDFKPAFSSNGTDVSHLARQRRLALRAANELQRSIKVEYGE